MRTPPPYKQLESLLWFLREALRSDSELLRYLETPDNIVNRTMEHDPFAVQDDDRVKLLDTELPLLAIWEISSTPDRDKRRNGEVVNLGMVYVFNVFHGSADLSPQAWAQRISKLVWWRINYWLRRKRFEEDNAPFDGTDTPYHLETNGGIHKVRAGRALRLGSREYEGIVANLTMTHYEPPFDDHEVAKLKTVDFEQHPGTVVPSTTGPIVEGLIDVDSSD